LNLEYLSKLTSHRGSKPYIHDHTNIQIEMINDNSNKLKLESS